LSTRKSTVSYRIVSASQLQCSEFVQSRWRNFDCGCPVLLVACKAQD